MPKSLARQQSTENSQTLRLPLRERVVPIDFNRQKFLQLPALASVVSTLRNRQLFFRAPLISYKMQLARLVSLIVFTLAMFSIAPNGSTQDYSPFHYIQLDDTHFVYSADWESDPPVYFLISCQPDDDDTSSFLTAGLSDGRDLDNSNPKAEITFGNSDPIYVPGIRIENSLFIAGHNTVMQMAAALRNSASQHAQQVKFKIDDNAEVVMPLIDAHNAMQKLDAACPELNK